METNDPKGKPTSVLNGQKNGTSEKDAKFEWSVNAYCYMKESPDNPCQQYIPIPWHGDNLKMSADNIRSGIPVDANLAVHYIKNFFDFFTMSVKAPLPPANLTPDMTFEEIQNSFNLFSTHHENYRKLHDSVFKLTYGMTLDKDLLLKTISQPKCEGIRFYLCARRADDDQLHLSLVTVGVDKNGCDLHYDLKDTVTSNQLLPGVNVIKTQSLTGEYATPPPPYTDVLKKDSQSSAGRKAAKMIDDYKKRFVLLNLAKKQQEDIKRAAKKPNPVNN